jgi:hypothetical protein
MCYDVETKKSIVLRNKYCYNTGMNKKGRKGIVLIFIVGILLVVVFVAIVFVSVAKINVTETQVFVDNIKARFAALSGLNFAIRKIPQELKRNYISFVGSDWVFNGEDFNLNGELEPEEDTNGNGRLDIFSVSLDKALRPSFALYKDADSIKRGYSYSSKVPAPYNKSGILNSASESTIYYVLKVKDTTQTLNLNDPNPKVVNMLKTVSELIGAGMSEEEIRDFVKSAREALILTSGTVKLPRRYLLSKLATVVSLYGKTIDKLLIPSPKVELIDKPIISVREMISDRLTTGSRSPININIAPPEIIEAVLRGLEGLYIEENINSPSSLPNMNLLLEAEDNLSRLSAPTTAEDIASTLSSILSLSDEEKLERAQRHFDDLFSAAVPRLKLLQQFKYIKSKDKYYGVVRKHKLSEGKAKQLAEHIVKKRYKDITKPAFYDYNDLRDFLNEEVKNRVINDLDRDLILAALNINSDFNKFNPNKSFYKRIDKSDLIEYTTEVVFGAIGTFEIESLGVVERKGDITARKTLIGVAEILKMFLDTTQKDFSLGYIRPNEDYEYPTYKGKTLQTYPEPEIGDLALKNELDGQLILATVNRELTTNHTFLASFENSVNATFAKDEGGLLGEYFIGKSEIEIPKAESVFKKGTLYPDGAYVDFKHPYPYKGRWNLPFKTTASFLFNGEREEFNFREFKVLLGIITFWVKANFDADEGEKTRSLFTAYSTLPGGDKVDRILEYLYQPKVDFRYKNILTTTPFLITDFTMPFLFAEMGRDEKKKTFFMPDPYFMLQDTVKIPPKYRLKTREWKHFGILLDEEGAQFTVIA